MNTVYKYFAIAFLSFGLFSCYKDKSTVDTHKLSEIQVTFPGITSNTINIEKNEILTIDPQISETGAQDPMTYEWQVNYEVFSTDKKFVYTGEKLGSFPVRLKVTNKDGSTFKEFTLNVNSPYEEGLLVLGEDENGVGTLAFMRTYTPEEIAGGKVPGFVNNCFVLNNPGHTLGKGVTDIVKRDQQLFISSADDQKISLINTKTFELESEITSPDFPGFKPYRLNIPDNGSTSAIVLSEDGKVYNLATKEHLVLKNTAFPDGTDLAMKTSFIGGMNFTSNYFWDNANSRLWDLWYINTNTKDTLAGQELIQFFATPQLVYVLTRDKNNPEKLTKSVFGPYIQVFFGQPLDYKEKEIFTNASPTLNVNSITVLSEKYNKLIYANGNEIYNWYYSGTNIPAAPYITVNAPGTITSMSLSPDGDQLYVGVYDAAASGLKGSVLIYNTDNGTLISKYENVSDKPVKLLYKKKS